MVAIFLVPSLPFWGTMVKKGVSGAGGEATPLELLDGPLLRGGRVEEDGATAGDDGSERG